MKNIQAKDVIESHLIKAYEEINGLDVIEQLLLYKGVEIAGENPPYKVSQKDLEYMALIMYRLKVTPTNKLNVGWYLDKFYKNHQLFIGETWTSNRAVKVPNNIYEKVKKVQDSFVSQLPQSAY